MLAVPLVGAGVLATSGCAATEQGWGSSEGVGLGGSFGVVHDPARGTMEAYVTGPDCMQALYVDPASSNVVPVGITGSTARVERMPSEIRSSVILKLSAVEDELSETLKFSVTAVTRELYPTTITWEILADAKDGNVGNVRLGKSNVATSSMPRMGPSPTCIGGSGVPTR